MDPYLNQFIQPDPIVPSFNNPQNINKYSYALNNPIRYTDPSRMYSVEKITQSLNSKTLEDVFGEETYGVPRWGLYAALWAASVDSYAITLNMNRSCVSRRNPILYDLLRKLTLFSFRDFCV